MHLSADLAEIWNILLKEELLVLIKLIINKEVHLSLDGVDECAATQLLESQKYVLLIFDVRLIHH